MAVDEGGFIFVADSGNNRIQIFNPDGTFLRAFGRWGQSDGEFKVSRLVLLFIVWSHTFVLKSFMFVCDVCITWNLRVLKASP